jgi:hypothetical protein
MNATLVHAYACYYLSFHKYTVSGLCPLSRFQNTKNTALPKLDLFITSGDGKETVALLGPLERANLSYWIQQSRCFPPLTDDGQSPETPYFWVLYTITTL